MNNQDLSKARNVEASKLSSGSYQSWLGHIHAQGNDGKKDKISTRIKLVAEYETDGSIASITMKI